MHWRNGRSVGISRHFPHKGWSFQIENGNGDFPIPKMKVELPKYRDGELIHQFSWPTRAVCRLSRYTVSNGAPTCPAV